MPIAGHASEQRWCRSRRHSSHAPHEGAQESATCWPGRTRRTPGPTASTMPAPSWPSTAGHGVVAVPSIAFRSEWQTPLAYRRTSASPARGGSSSSSAISSRPPVSGSTAARTFTRAPIVSAAEAARPPASAGAPRAGCGSASCARARPRRARLDVVADRDRGSAGSGCGRRSRTAGSPRTGSRPRAGSARRSPSIVATAESSASV